MIEPAPAEELQIEQALTDLIMDCPELEELESRLSQFNIFRVLRADRHEIRHSNMLAWLMNPEESHGFGDRFLRRWLMSVTHGTEPDPGSVAKWPSPIEIDSLDIEYVDVARETANIDLLLVIRAANDVLWVVCIENKVESKQHSNQLLRYRRFVEGRYGEAEHRIFVFLTKNDELPDDPEFLISSYEAVHDALVKCLKERNDTIGQEPKFLISQYLELLAEDFVGESRSAQLARQIYRRHKTAIDFILEQRKDPISEATSVMSDVINNLADELSLTLAVAHKGYVRFVPPQWNVPQNRGGTAWGTDSPYVLCEINFWTKRMELHMTIGKAPDDWANRVWERAATAPFKQEWKKRPAQFIKPFKSKSEVSVESLADTEEEDMRNRFTEWIRDELNKPKFQFAAEAIRELILELPEK